MPLDASIWSAFVVAGLTIVATIVYIIMFQKEKEADEKDG